MENIKLTPKRKEIIEIMGFDCMMDILRYYPYRYDCLKISTLSYSLHDQKICVEGSIISDIKVDMFSKKRMKTIFVIQYENTPLKIIVFNRFGWSKILKRGTHLVITGKYNAFNQEVVASSFFVGSLNNQEKWVSYYRLKKEIKETTYKNFVAYVFDEIERLNIINDIIPENFIKKYRLCSLKDALKGIHFPSSEQQLHQANRHLKYEEFLLFSLTGILKRRMTSLFKGWKNKAINVAYIETFIKRLPFELTKDQAVCVQEILHDLQGKSTMSRLLQGDVGSGKTVVALIALVANYTASLQGAFMAPTDLLARQHYQYVKDALKDTPIRVALLVSDMTTKEKESLLKQIEEGKMDILIGTHALIQNKVIYHNLGLAIVDEQHRFGVKQRVLLKEKGEQVDVLYMSATPIPRTLASTFYMDMDVSTIEIYPYKERKIETYFIHENKISSFKKQIEEYLISMQKIYVICPCIEESVQELSDIKKIFESFAEKFSNYKVGFLHGKQKADEKQSIMAEFYQGTIQILVSTTVIEVGINIMDANMMIIYNAERFGLAQIHQLRGRIARDGKKGTCYLLSDSEDEDVINRLQFISQTNDGFKISEYDLKRRGAGDMLGLAQSGKSPFVLASLIDDFTILKVASQDAKEIMKNPKQYQEIVDLVYRKIRTSEKYVD